MRILIAAAGSRGDVAPCTGPGAALRRAGHDVALAAPDIFAPLAHHAGAGTSAAALRAGAGTSAAALRAGAPAVPVPVAADQPFWAGRLAALGAATEPIPFRELTVERLADALGRTTRDHTHTHAHAAARRMAAEDAAGRTVAAAERLVS
jgi:UDP:flavonoid glycosyltransferase YjiC (YdhE family)